MTRLPEGLRDSNSVRHWSVGLAVAGLGVLAIGSVLSVERAWGNLLVTAYALAGLGLGAAFFQALCGVTGARWNRPLSPLVHRLVATLPLSGLAAGVVVVAGLYCYPWAHGLAEHTGRFWFKDAWLSPGFFLARTVGYVVVWALAARWIMGSLSPSPGRSACSLLLLAGSLGLAGVDWVMSLEPLWFSTMFGVYQFAGVFLSGLAGLVVYASWCRRGGCSPAGMDVRQLHDLGKLLFGFSCFWMYIWLSQYLLIWYVNIPEESVYLVRRTEGLWWPLLLLNVLLNWAIPFGVLLPRPAKRSWTTMARVSVMILVGRWLDLYLMVLPALGGARAAYGVPELGGLLLGGGALLLLFQPRALECVLEPGTGGVAVLQQHEPGRGC